MKRLLTLLGALVLAGAVCGGAAAQIRVGSIADSRGGGGWTLDGGNMTNTRAKLLNAANFGSSGVASPAIQITDIAGTVDASALANLDVLFIGYFPTGTFSGAELAAMQTWVNAGHTIIATCDDASFSDVCTTFGHTPTTSASPPVHPTVAGSTHPIFNGPFGLVASINMAGTEGYFPSTGGATVLGVDSSGSPLATVMLQSFGSGRVIFVVDVDMLSDFTVSAGPAISNGNDRFLGNVFAFAGSAIAGGNPQGLPVPALDPTLLAALALMLTALAVPVLRKRG